MRLWRSAGQGGRVAAVRVSRASGGTGVEGTSAHCAQTSPGGHPRRLAAAGRSQESPRGRVGAAAPTEHVAPTSLPTLGRSACYFASKSSVFCMTFVPLSLSCHPVKTREGRGSHSASCHSGQAQARAGAPGHMGSLEGLFPTPLPLPLPSPTLWGGGAQGERAAALCESQEGHRASGRHPRCGDPGY